MMLFLLLFPLSFSFTDAYFSIMIKSGYSYLAKEIISKLSHKTELYRNFRQEALYNYERSCNGKRMKDCPPAYKYALAAYFLSHLENFSTIERYDLTDFDSKIGPKTTHVIFILPEIYNGADQLSLYFKRKVNVSIVSLESQQHFIELIGGDYRSYVDRLYLESIHADIETQGNLQVGKLILYNSSYSRSSNYYTVAKSVPLYLHVNSIPRLKSTSVDDTYVFSDECDIDAIGYKIRCGNKKYEKPQSDRSITYYTSSNKVEVYSDLTLSFQNIQFIKINDIFKMILNFDDSTIDLNGPSHPTELLTIKYPSTYSIDVTISPGKTLQIVGINDSPIDISDTSVTLGQFSRILLNVDDLDMDTLPPEPISEETKPVNPKFALFFMDQSYGNDYTRDTVLKNMNHTDILFHYLHNQSIALHKEYCKEKDIKDCPEAIAYREAEYILSNAVQIIVSHAFKDLKNISEEATHLLILVFDPDSYQYDYIDFSLLTHKMNVTIAGLRYSNPQISITGGDYRDKVDRLYLSVELYIREDHLKVGTIIFNPVFHEYPKYSPYTISNGVPVLTDTSSLYDVISGAIDNIYVDIEDCEVIELLENAVQFSPYNHYMRTPPKKALTVFTLTDHLVLNIQKYRGNYFNKIIISPHKVRYLDAYSAVKKFNVDLIRTIQNRHAAQLKKRPKIVSDRFTLSITGGHLKDLPSSFSIEIQLPKSAKLNVVDDYDFPVPLTRYGIKKN